MYGEGYDYVPQYTPMGGDMVGALPVGLGARNDDVPYWPAGNNEPSKREQWVQTVARFINLAGNVTGPALVEGRSGSVVEFKNRVSEIVTRVAPDASGNFRSLLPQGNYQVTAGGFEKQMTLLPGGNHRFDASLDFVVASTTSQQNQITIEVTARGTGRHAFKLRTENLTVSGAEQEVTLTAGPAQKLKWEARIVAPEGPWFVVVVPNGDLAQRQELLDRSGN
jgi:hypothetical protein